MHLKDSVTSTLTIRPPNKSANLNMLNNSQEESVSHCLKKAWAGHGERCDTRLRTLISVQPHQLTKLCNCFPVAE